jgi:hypothetical protein
MAKKKGKKRHPYARAPFPAMGGKSAVAEMVWQRLGSVRNYVAPMYRASDAVMGAYCEPFANSIALLLANPDYDWENGRWSVRYPPLETVNDLDCFIANFWRSVANDPEATAHWANWPVSEADLHSRHAWLVRQHDFAEQMMADPDYYDPKIAGWWVWGACLWIGGGWCATEYSRASGLKLDGETTERRRPKVAGPVGVHKRSLNGGGSRTADGGTAKKRPYVGHSGRGVHRKGLPQQMPSMDVGRGVTRKGLQRPHLSGSGLGINGRRLSQQKPVLNGRSNIYVPGEGVLADYFEALSSRLRGVRILCGDWSRAVTDVVTWNNNSTRGPNAITSIVFDAPYSAEAGRTAGLYAQDDLEVSHKVREWCLEWIESSDGFEGYRYDHPKLRLILCGYEDEHGPHMPDTWECVAWKAHGGYENQNRNKMEEERNRGKERIWFSPNCLRPSEVEELPLLAWNE